MGPKISESSRPTFDLDLDKIAGLILKVQKPNGEIPWSVGDKTDPWDHVEAAMGLSIGGYLAEARQAYVWMTRNQLEDGSWYAYYRDGLPHDRTRDTNMSAYIAVGVLHHYLITEDASFLREMWTTVSLAMEFALSLQSPSGEIYWAMSPEGRVDPMALLTGCSSIFMSLKCALVIADLTGHSRPRWQKALERLGDAIRNKPTLFNMTKARFSMDWFYPILCGAVTGSSAQQRILNYWKKFVVKARGVRCVSDRPWITVAETSELCIALAAMGNTRLSEMVFTWIQENRFEDGSYWCGYTFPDSIIWPEEKLTWTNAAVMLAADALYDITPAGRLFSHRFWISPEISSLLGYVPQQEQLSFSGRSDVQESGFLMKP